MSDYRANIAAARIAGEYDASKAQINFMQKARETISALLKEHGAVLGTLNLAIKADGDLLVLPDAGEGYRMFGQAWTKDKTKGMNFGIEFNMKLGYETDFSAVEDMCVAVATDIILHLAEKDGAIEVGNAAV